MASSPSDELVARRKSSFKELYPDLTFHYGLSWYELVKMPNWLKRMYVDALPRLLAEQQLTALQATAFPNMKKGARSSLVRKLERRAKRRTRGEVLAPKKLEEAAAMAGIGIVKVPVGGEKEAGQPKRPELIRG